MALSSFAAGHVPEAPKPGTVDPEYRPGLCNIGPAEIVTRRRAGHVGLLATVVLLGALIVVGASPLARLIVAIPAAGSASGYLQAWLKFCAGFGSRGIANFGPLGQFDQVVGTDARARDRARAYQIGLASLVIGVAVAVAAVLLPL